MIKCNHHTLSLDKDKTLETAMTQIRDLNGQVVVNILSDPKAAPLFFSIENLDAALSFQGDALILETLPEKQYRKLMIKEVQLVNASSEKLRMLLRDHFLYDIKDAVKKFLNQFQNIALLLSCYALQKPGSGVAKNMETLQSLFKQLEAACFTFRDNVRFMDDLQYGVMPTLQSVIKEMQEK